MTTEDYDSPQWHVALDEDVTREALKLLRCAAEAVESGRPDEPLLGPIYDGCVKLRTDLVGVVNSKIFLSLRNGMFAVSGYVQVLGHQHSIVVEERPAIAGSIGSLLDRPSILERIERWSERILTGSHQDNDLVERHRARLGELVEAAAHVSLPTWSGLILEPNFGEAPPNLWDEDGHPAFTEEIIEYRLSKELMTALIDARDPFAHIRQELQPSHIAITVGGAAPITLHNSRDPVNALRLVARLPSGASFSPAEGLAAVKKP